MKPSARSSFAIALASLMGAWLLVAGAAQPVLILVLPFAGDGALGRNVANVLYLQVWQSLRSAPYPNPQHESFGDGKADWGEAPLPNPSHDDAAAAAARVGGQLALWGKAWKIGSGVAAQTYLTVTNEAAAANGWSVNLTIHGTPYALSCALPTSKYEFAPIVLRQDVVSLYSGLPSGLPLYADQSEAHPIGYAGDAFMAKEQRTPEWSRVQVGAQEGWIHLPKLSNAPSEVSTFTAGLIRILRKDWVGATEEFRVVLAYPHTPTAVAIDAHLLNALALARHGGDPMPDIVAAERLNPLSARVATYGIAARLAAVASTPITTDSRPKILEIQEYLDQKARLFAPDDRWLSKAREILSAARSAAGL